MAFRTQYNSPRSRGEVFTQPSLTDELADEPLSEIVKRFTLPQIVGGYLRQQADVVADSKLTEEDLEAAFDDFTTADLPLMDKVDQAEAMVAAQLEIERLQKLIAKQPNPKPVKPQEYPEEKEASKDTEKA